MKSIADIIDSALKPGDMATLNNYRGRELDFFIERGRTYPEKLAEIFFAIFNAECEDLIVVGPRGGGKTMGIYDGATALFMWKDFDVFALGGSEKQAINGFRYMRQILYRESELADNLQESLKKGAVGPRGNWFSVSAASTKAVRGPHPGDPHPEMGWVDHGGLLIKDERDEMDDEVSDAVDFMIDTAEPAIIVTSSTMHRDDGGGIAQMVDEAVARGARVIKFDIFDVSQVCKHDCAKCPGGFAFAGALFGGESTKEKLENGAPALPKATVESILKCAAWQKANAWVPGEPAYCLGRAKMHSPGHYKMAKIFRAFRRSRNREIFEVELCCRKRKGIRRVVDAASLDLCLDETVSYQPGYPEPVITIDWGFKGWTVLCLVQPQADNTIAVIDCRYEHMTSIPDIVAICEEWQRTTGASEIFADSSHPFENQQAAAAGFEVTEIKFQVYKEYGASWIKGIVERKVLRIQGKIQKASSPGEAPQYIFQSEAFEQLFLQIKGWQRDKHGKIIKKNDHGPDSLSCAAQKFAESQEWEPDFLGTGQRDSFSMGGM